MFDTSELVLNMGPQHPSTHGVLRVVLRLDGEKVVDADVVIGYLHRGIEKLSENRNWTQIILLTDRMDYVAAATSNVGYCETVEKLMQLEVPRRARYIRTILCELQRIASHCLWLGTHAMDIGAMTVFLYAFRERELILDLFEEFCGARLTYNSMRIGGLPLDIPAGLGQEGPRVLRDHGLEDRRVRDAADAQPHLAGADEGHRRHRRAGGGGARPVRSGAARFRRAARRPQGRAVRGLRRNGVRHPDRHGRRHLRSVSRAHGGIPPVAADHPAGDRGPPEGPIVGKVPRLIKPAAGETYHAIESPKGELGYFIVSDGKSTNPYRFRVRPPSFCNLQALPRLVRGHLVADVVALIGSIDIVLGEVDR